METEIKSKSELETLAKLISDETTHLGTLTNAICSTLGSVSDYDGIPASSAGRTLSSNLKTIMEDFNTATTNINSYISELIAFDVNDFPENDMDELLTVDEIELPDIIPSGNTLQETEVNSESLKKEDKLVLNAVAPIIHGVENEKPDDKIINGEKEEEAEKNDDQEKSNHQQTNEPQPQTTPSPGINQTPTQHPEQEQNPVVSVIETEGLVSENGLTQRSSIENIEVTIGKNTDISVYKNDISNGFEVTTGSYAYELNDKDVELLYAIIAAEGDKSYDDSLALMSTLLNRCEDEKWISLLGKDPIAQITAVDQFTTYQKGTYMQYLGRNVTDVVKRAVDDALKGVRNHNYLNFSKNTNFSSFMITETGNRYK